MRMYTYAANDMRAITDFVNENGIKKEDIVGIYETKSGVFMLNYFAE